MRADHSLCPREAGPLHVGTGLGRCLQCLKSFHQKKLKTIIPLGEPTHSQAPQEAGAVQPSVGSGVLLPALPTPAVTQLPGLVQG